jgi:hypothetical protein
MPTLARRARVAEGRGRGFCAAATGSAITTGTTLAKKGSFKSKKGGQLAAFPIPSFTVPCSRVSDGSRSVLLKADIKQAAGIGHVEFNPA